MADSQAKVEGWYRQYGIARHMGISTFRRRKIIGQLPDAVAAKETQADLRLAEMRQTIARLPEEMRETLELRLAVSLVTKKSRPCWKSRWEPSDRDCTTRLESFARRCVMNDATLERLMMDAALGALDDDLRELLMVQKRKTTAKCAEVPMRKILSLVLTLLIALMVGCDPEQYVVWAPDGAKAAVIGADGLHLCDANGKLTPLLVKDVRKVAWFADSTHIVAARDIKVSSWNQASKYLETERIKRLETESENLFKDLMAQQSPLDQWGQALLESPSGPDAGDFVAMVLCMAEKHADELKKKLTEEDWKKLQEGQGISITLIQMYEIAASQAKDGPILASTFSKVTDLRPSPNGKVLAYITSDGGERALCYLFVVPVDGAAQPTRVSDLCGLYADWSYDGKYIAYARANPPRASAQDSLRLGTLRRMQVCEADGTLKAQVPIDEVKKVKGPDGKINLTSSPAESLVGIVFNEMVKVRCLRDGRIVFVSAEMTLPMTSDDTPTRLSLFAIDPGKQATVSRLLSRKAEAEVGDAIQYFEINPDQTLVAIPGSTGQITVVPLSGGNVIRMNGQLQDKIRMVPSWRGSDELCYAVGNKPQEQNGRAADVYLWQLAKEPRCISKDWPDEVVAVMKQN